MVAALRLDASPFEHTPETENMFVIVEWAKAKIAIHLLDLVRAKYKMYDKSIAKKKKKEDDGNVWECPRELLGLFMYFRFIFTSSPALANKASSHVARIALWGRWVANLHTHALKKDWATRPHLSVVRAAASLRST